MAEQIKTIKLIDDPKIMRYAIGDQGCTVLVTGETGSGKTLSIRPLIEYLGVDEVLIVATDPRLAPLDGLGARVIPAWIEPGAEGLELKNAAAAAWEKIQALSKDLIAAVKNPKVQVPKALVFDGLSNFGDIHQSRLAQADGVVSERGWGQIGNGILNFTGFIRGLQLRGLFRVLTCTTGPTRDSKGGIITGPTGQPMQRLYIGTGGRLAPDHIVRYIDYMFHTTAYYGGPTAEGAGPDGMVRKFQTCTADGVTAKGAPQLPTPFMSADLAEVYRRVIEGKKS
jgi:hypothetical protein